MAETRRAFGRRLVASRATAVMLVAAAHLQLLSSFGLHTRRVQTHSGIEAGPILVFLAPNNVAVQSNGNHARISTARWRDDPPRTQPMDARSQAANSVGAAIDWAREAQLGATRALVAAIERERLAAAFAPKRTLNLAEMNTAPAAAPSFRWSHARTHRIERSEDGTTMFWLNDRCMLVNFLLPVCAVGEIPAHGDLFEHMDDPPKLGDWQDDSAAQSANMPP